MTADPAAPYATPPVHALETASLTKSFGATRALDDVDLRVEAGTVHCLLGENGAGKSTLCHLVGGSLTPESGTMRLYGRVYAPRRPGDALSAGIAMVHQHFSLLPTLTVEENLRLQRLPRRELADRLTEIADTYGLTVDLHARVADLPVGVRQRVEIVKSLLRRPRLLLLDEPTAVLGPTEVDALLATCRRIADTGHAVVLITHKLGEVARAGDAATVLRGGRVAGGGPLADLPPERLVQLMIGRSADHLAPVLARAVGLPDDPEPAPASDAGPLPAPPVPAPPPTTTGPAALRLREVTVRRADGSVGLDAVALDIAPGEILGVAGVEGNGQSELMAVLGGSLTPDGGTVELAGRDVTRDNPLRRTRAGLAIVPEDRHHEGCVPRMSIADNLFLGRLGEFRRARFLLDRRALHRAAADVLIRDDIRAAGPTATMAGLSGGNQQKVVLARELALDPLVALAAAQPTRGLDVGAVDAVLTRVREAAARGAGVLLVSSELGELLAVCDRVAVAYRGRLLGPVRADAPDAAAHIGRLMTGAAPTTPADPAPEPPGDSAGQPPAASPAPAPAHPRTAP